jgi:hypothetical protein
MLSLYKVPALEIGVVLEPRRAWLSSFGFDTRHQKKLQGDEAGEKRAIFAAAAAQGMSP